MDTAAPVAKTITKDQVKLYQPEFKDLPLHRQNLELIQDALYKTVNGLHGTGGAAKVPGVDVYGKTGSAENHMGEESHAWFSGYASWEEPEISFTVFWKMVAEVAGWLHRLPGKSSLSTMI